MTAALAMKLSGLIMACARDQDCQDTLLGALRQAQLAAGASRDQDLVPHLDALQRCHVGTSVALHRYRAEGGSALAYLCSAIQALSTADEGTALRFLVLAQIEATAVAMCFV